MRQIDTYSESMISMDDAAKHVSMIAGKKRNRHLLLRWARSGVCGIKLPAIQVSRDVMTSKEALNDFLNAVRQAKQKQRSRETKVGMRAAKLSCSQLEREANELGI